MTEQSSAPPPERRQPPPPLLDPAPPVDPGPGGSTMLMARPPRAGELTPKWRIAVGATWAAVTVALAAVWNTSVQLGLSTWWLGPRGEPRPFLIHLVPFVAPVLMVLAAINGTRRLALSGLVAAGAVAAVGLGDLGRVTGLGVVELVIAAAAAAVSLASLTGTYRPDTTRSETNRDDVPTV